MKHIVIIGGGLGGLTSGALLSKSGHKVTLIEQHNIVGGSATTFKRPGGFTVEVGLHEMDDPFAEGPKKQIFEALGVYDNIEFVRPEELFHVKTAKSEFVMPDGIDAAIKALKERYPSDNQGIDTYFERITAIAKEYGKLSKITWWQKLLFPFVFRNVFKYRQASLQSVLDELFTNEELKLILCTNIQYYHNHVSDFSFLYHSIAQYGYYSGGGWYIKGGSQKLSNYLASVIKEHGGEIIKRANVVKVLRNGKEVIGVDYVQKGQEQTLNADLVVSNASPMQTYAMADTDYEQKQSVGISLYTLYLGFSKNIKEVYGKGAYSTFDFSRLATIAEYESAIDLQLHERPTAFVDYSQIDSALTPEDKSLGVVCGTDTLEAWNGLSEDEYKSKKDEITESLIAGLEKDYPGISDLVEYAELGTAKTMARYLQTPEGTAYGFAPTESQFFRTPQVKSDKLNNLYFVGAWVIGGGFTPAIMSGAMAAHEIGK